MAKRLVDWTDNFVGLQIASGAQAETRLDGGVTDVVARTLTVVRTIISLDISSDTVAGAWGLQELFFGIGVFSREAFNAGIFPEPSQALEKPARGWLWRGHRSVAQNGAGAPIVTHMQADIRGSRRLDNGVLVLVVDSAALSGTTFVVNVRGMTRCLMKL